MTSKLPRPPKRSKRRINSPFTRVLAQFTVVESDTVYSVGPFSTFQSALSWVLDNHFAVTEVNLSIMRVPPYFEAEPDDPEEPGF